MTKQRYANDLTDREWVILQPLLPLVHKPGPCAGRPESIAIARSWMQSSTCCEVGVPGGWYAPGKMMHTPGAAGIENAAHYAMEGSPECLERLEEIRAPSR
jgi:hypothetical protein